MKLWVKINIGRCELTEYWELLGTGTPHQLPHRLSGARHWREICQVKERWRGSVAIGPGHWLHLCLIHFFYNTEILVLCRIYALHETALKDVSSNIMRTLLHII